MDGRFGFRFRDDRPDQGRLAGFVRLTQGRLRLQTGSFRRAVSAWDTRGALGRRRAPGRAVSAVGGERGISASFVSLRGTTWGAWLGRGGERAEAIELFAAAKRWRLARDAAGDWTLALGEESVRGELRTGPSGTESSLFLRDSSARTGVALHLRFPWEGATRWRVAAGIRVDRGRWQGTRADWEWQSDGSGISESGQFRLVRVHGTTRLEFRSAVLSSGTLAASRVSMVRNVGSARIRVALRGASSRTRARVILDFERATSRLRFVVPEGETSRAFVRFKRGLFQGEVEWARGIPVDWHFRVVVARSGRGSPH